jgi:hypothetical protein
MTWATCPQVVKYTFGPPATMAIFIFDFWTTLEAAALVLPLDVDPLEVLPLDVLPLLQAAAPRMAIAASGARYLQARRPPAVLLR